MQNLLGKLVLIILIIAGCAALLYPPSKRLKGGTDLAGGTTVTYQVILLPDQSASADDTISQIIEVWKDRLDPNGVRNLVFQPIAGNRIQVTMAAASEEIRELRGKYTEAKTALEARNINAAKVDSMLRLPKADRQAEIDRLAGENEALKTSLNRLVQNYDDVAAAKRPYEKAQDAHRAAERELQTLRNTESEDAEATTKKIAEKEAEVEAKLRSLIAATQPYVEAQRRLEASKTIIYQANINMQQVDAIESLLDNVDPARKKRAIEKFNTAISKLINDYPQHKAGIQAVADTYLAYDAKRGPYDDPKDMIRDLAGSGVLEFRISGNIAPPETFEKQREALLQNGPNVTRNDAFSWFEIGSIEEFVDKELLLESEKDYFDRTVGKGSKEFAEAEQIIEDPEQGVTVYMEQQPEESDEDYERRAQRIFGNRGLVVQPYAGKIYALLGNSPENSITESQEGWSVRAAQPSVDERGFRAVAVRLDTVGGDLMSSLTRKYEKQLLCVTLDKKLMNAATIQTRLSDRFQITGGSGGFSETEIKYLTRVLSAGSVAASVEGPISVVTTSPQFGEDNLQRGLDAAIFAIIAVAVFMAIYYLFCGFVADFALAANVLIILGVMSALQATFTLPGIAGIILTIGMAVDANVLIFERIREELERKVELEDAVRLGFGKAFSTIIDANVTTIITCFVLYYLATVEVKGFALTLMIGVIASMFTALFCSRVLIDLYIAILKPKTLQMLPTIVPAVRNLLHPRVSWTKLRPTLFIVSVVLMGIGLGLVSVRGSRILDIEFLGGTQVTFGLKQGQSMSVEDARARLTAEAEKLEDADLKAKLLDVRLYSAGDVVKDPNEYATFTISTVSQKDEAVEQTIATAFKDVLAVDQAIQFKDADAAIATAPIAAIVPLNSAGDDERWQLGNIIGMPALKQDVRTFAGGVAIKVADLSEPLTAAAFKARIDNLRVRQDLPSRTLDIIGTNIVATPAGAENQNESWYDSFVVLVNDRATDYITNQSQLREKDGMANAEWQLIVEALTSPSTIGNVVGIDGSVSATMKNDAILAMALSLLAVVAYIWIRFGNLKYGIAAIAALVHDVTIALGFIALSFWMAGYFMIHTPFRIDLAMIAAFLTIVGYSLNDTIVVFDRIRENRGKLTIATPAIIDDSINQTISRTALTSLTTILALITLYVVGGPGVHGFAFTMLVGVVIGTYSSIGVAANVLLVPGRAFLALIAAAICLLIAIAFFYFSGTSISQDASEFAGWARGFFGLVFAVTAIAMFIAAKKMQGEDA